MEITIVAGFFTTLNTFLGIYLTQWRHREVTVAPAGAAAPPSNPTG